VVLPVVSPLEIKRLNLVPNLPFGEVTRLFVLLFGWLPVDTTGIKRKIAAPTQLASIPVSTTLKATDTVYSDTRDIDSSAVLLFVGTETLPQNILPLSRNSVVIGRGFADESIILSISAGLEPDKPERVGEMSNCRQRSAKYKATGVPSARGGKDVELSGSLPEP
jgi:hypothetical protein